MVASGVKLLLDQNISLHLVRQLDANYPGTAHVRDLDMGRASDQRIWEYAIEEEFVILSKDSDFCHRSLLFGQPPQVIWLALGNCTTSTVNTALESAAESIQAFGADGSRSLLILR